MVTRHNGRIGPVVRLPCELNVTSLLTDLTETRRFKTTLDLAESQRPKSPQPLPRFGAPQADAWRPAARSAALAPRADWRELLLRCVPDWPRPHPDTAKRTNHPQPRRLPKKDAS